MQRPFTPRESPQPPRQAFRLIALAALSAALLAGCGSSGVSSSRTAGTAVGVAPAPDSIGPNSVQSAGSAPGADSSAGAKGGTPALGSRPVASGGTTAGGAAPGAPVAGVGPKLTKSASLSVRVKNIDAAAAQVRTIAAGVQAQVLNEQIGTGGPGGPGPVPLQGKADAASGFGTLTLSVPADKLDTTLDQLAGRLGGTVLQRSLSTQDVTAQYIDTTSRLKTMRASVDRVRALMVQAKDLGQVVALESELSRRQADLESLESQLAALSTSVERSTLSVTLSTPGSEPVTRDSGFGAGLRSGWDAFTASARGLLTGIGATLPFAVFFALVAAPIVWWLRRRRQVGAAAPVTP
jgi:hypothetical protein